MGRDDRRRRGKAKKGSDFSLIFLAGLGWVGPRVAVANEIETSWVVGEGGGDCGAHRPHSLRAGFVSGQAVRILQAVGSSNRVK